MLDSEYFVKENEDVGMNKRICSSLQIKGYAVPRILLIFPWSIKLIGLIFLRTGHVKKTSPPPSGLVPLLIILKRFKYFFGYYGDDGL